MTQMPVTMPDPSHPEPDDRPSSLHYTDGELFELDKDNLRAVIAGTLGFLRRYGADPAARLPASGDVFARRWDESQPWASGEFLDAIAVVQRSLGAAIVALDATAETDTAPTHG